MKEVFEDLADAAKNLGSQATGVMEQAGADVGRMGDLGGDVAATMTDDIN